MMYGQHEDTLGVSKDMNKLHDRIQHLGDAFVNKDIEETIQRHNHYEQPQVHVYDSHMKSDYLGQDFDYDVPAYRHVPSDLVARNN